MNFKCLRLFLFIAGMTAILLTGCTDPKSKGEEIYLIRIGGSVVTVLEFNKALEIAKTAYPHNSLQDSNATRAIRLRLLDEMTDETILLEKARELAISVSDDEVEEEVAKFKGDYPDDVFEKTLLENAISYNTGKRNGKFSLKSGKIC